MANKTVLTAGLLSFFLNTSHLKTDDIISTGSWIVNSTSRYDFVIIEQFNESRFEDRLKIIQNVSRREDRDFSAIIENIYYNRELSTHEREFLLYSVLQHFFTDLETADINRDIHKEISKNICSFADSLLRKKVLKKIHFLNSQDALKVLLMHADFLLKKSETKEWFKPELLEETKIIMRISREYDSLPLNESLITLYNSVLNIPPDYHGR